MIKCSVAANSLFLCLVARPLAGGWIVGIFGEAVDETTGILLIFLFFETVCDFFNWVNLSEILVGEISCLWLIVGTLSKIKNVKQRAASLGLFFSYYWDTTPKAVPPPSPSPPKMLPLEKNPFLLFNWYLPRGVLTPPPPTPSKGTCPLIVL